MRGREKGGREGGVRRKKGGKKEIYDGIHHVMVLNCDQLSIKIQVIPEG